MTTSAKLPAVKVPARKPSARKPSPRPVSVAPPPPPVDPAVAPEPAAPPVVDLAADSPNVAASEATPVDAAPAAEQVPAEQVPEDGAAIGTIGAELNCEELPPDFACPWCHHPFWSAQTVCDGLWDPVTKDLVDHPPRQVVLRSAVLV